MPFLPKPFRPASQRTRSEVRQAADQRRGSARARGYDSRWDKAAKAHLDRNPLCVYCAMGVWGDEPRDTAAVLVDHLIPHRGDMAVFWSRRDWVSSCEACHSGPKQRIERRSAALAVFANDVRRHLAAGAPTPGGGSIP
ncbi:hypothetical protein [Phenylobacterium sp.]|uniref:hypothetical protein n=1 Tax=Phenylobacterium sp. TaxID=1871053 RepID=UPI0035AE83B9